MLSISLDYLELEKGILLSNMLMSKKMLLQLN